MKKHLLFLCSFLALGWATPAASWQPVEGVLQTPWTRDVTPDRVLPEYPRPQMVRTQWVNLNGLWDYAIREQAPAAASRDAGGKAVRRNSPVLSPLWKGQILVPFAIESALSGVGRRFEPGQQLVYHRTFARPELPKGQRLLLHFGAADWQAVVFVNGQRVGEHRGGYDPFTFDITGAVSAGGAQELMVEIEDLSDKGYQPAGKQSLRPPNKCYYTPVSGIWQTVWLEAVPAAHITRVLAEAEPSLGGLVVRVDAEGCAAGQKATALLREGERVVSQGTVSVGQPLRLAVSKPRLWSPEDPYLYDLEVSLPGGDRVRSYCALRRIEILPDELGRKKLALNGKIQFLFGPLDQGYWPDGLYTAPTDEALRFDIETMKRLGFNVVRKHIKVEPARWYYWCDKLGLMVWQDLPSARGLSGDEGRRNFDREALAMIEALRPFPGIVMWGLFNEGWGQSGYGLAQSRQLADWLRQEDSTRLINAASGWTDVGGDHLNDLHVYPSPAMPPYDGERAPVVGEFGGLAASVKGHLWRMDKGGRGPEDNGELRNRYQQLFPTLRLCQGQGLAAAIYTQLTDVEGELNGYLTYDRKIQKMGADWLLSLHRQVFTPAPAVATLAGGAVPWAFTTNVPGRDWQALGFDDAAWEHARGPFGANYRGAKITTPWTSPAIRLRQTFQLSELAKAYYLFAREMRGAVLRLAINGTALPVDGCVAATGWVVPLQGRQALKAGTNVLTVEATRSQNGGQASFDVRLLTGQAAHVYHSFDEMARASDSVLPKVEALTVGPNYHWFGYYDKDLLDPSGRYLLSMQVDFEHRLPKAGEVAKVGMIDLKAGNHWVELGESRAWSWQQGSMLQWRPGSDHEVLWNDCESNRFVCRILDVRTGVMRTLPLAIESISPDGKHAAGSDFSRIWNIRTGYGYPGVPDVYADQNAPAELGVWVMDMETGRSRMLVSVADLFKVPYSKPQPQPQPDQKHYINHLAWSPDARRLSLFHRWTGRGQPTRVFTIGADGSDLRLLSASGASHWTWRDLENVLIWAIDSYGIYQDDGSGEPKKVLWAAPNGHPTYISGTDKTWIVTDTYPQGKTRKQHLYLYHVPTGSFVPLGRFTSPAPYSGEWRCDLHPYVTPDGKSVVIESVHGGNGRQLYRIPIEQILEAGVGDRARLGIPLAPLRGAETLVYKKAGKRELRIFVEKPADWKPTDRRAAIVFYHGGAWTGGAPSQFLKQSEYLATRGMIGLRVEYRLIPKEDSGPPTTCCADAKSAMRYVRSHAAELGIDPERIAAAGGSAGGYLAAFTALVNGLDDPQDDPAISCRPNALVLFNPVFNNGPGQWGHARVGDRFHEFSPAHNVTKAAPPTVLFLGDADKFIPLSVLRDFEAEMKKVGARCDAHVYPKAEHGFFNREPNSTQTLIETDKFLASLGWIQGPPTLKPPKS